MKSQNCFMLSHLMFICLSNIPWRYCDLQHMAYFRNIGLKPNLEIKLSWHVLLNYGISSRRLWRVPKTNMLLRKLLRHIILSNILNNILTFETTQQLTILSYVFYLLNYRPYSYTYGPHFDIVKHLEQFYYIIIILL